MKIGKEYVILEIVWVPSCSFPVVGYVASASFCMEDLIFLNPFSLFGVMQKFAKTHWAKSLRVGTKLFARRDRFTAYDLNIEIWWNLDEVF